ncbi:MAG: hypothetical protein AB9869_34940 [Verrucomicrobiia bacterium]
MHRLFAHPLEDRFDAADVCEGLLTAGLVALQKRELWGVMVWFIAAKPKALATARTHGPSSSAETQLPSESEGRATGKTRSPLPWGHSA